MSRGLVSQAPAPYDPRHHAVADLLHSPEASSTMHSTLLAVLLALSVAACTSISIPASQLPERVAKAASIPTDALLVADFVRFAESTRRERYAQFLPGAYAQTKTTVYLLSYNSEAQSFSVKTALPLSQLQSTSVATRGAFSHLQQLQLESPTGYIAINFSNSSDAEAGSKERTGAAVAQLERAGTKVGTTDFWFLPSNLQGFGFPIPAAK